MNCIGANPNLNNFEITATEAGMPNPPNLKAYVRRSHQESLFLMSINSENESNIIQDEFYFFLCFSY